MQARKVLAALGVAGAVAGGLALATPAANADVGPGNNWFTGSMGNCAYGSGGGWGGGGFCDGPIDEYGNQYHCETVYVLGFGGTNCFWRHVGP